MHPDRYGLGLMLGDLTVPLRGVHACGALPACKCQLFKCYFHTATVGHAGLDYGSGMPLIGYMTELNKTGSDLAVLEFVRNSVKHVCNLCWIYAASVIMTIVATVTALFVHVDETSAIVLTAIAAVLLLAWGILHFAMLVPARVSANEGALLALQEKRREA